MLEVASQHGIAGSGEGEERDFRRQFLAIAKSEVSVKHPLRSVEFRRVTAAKSVPHVREVDSLGALPWHDGLVL